MRRRVTGGGVPPRPRADRTSPGRAWRRLIAGAAAAAILAGCAVGPNYRRPETPVDAHFANAGEPGLKDEDTVERYWTGFADPLLDSLVDDALAHNTDLGVAAANLQAARAAKRLAGFDQFPTATFAGSEPINSSRRNFLTSVDGACAAPAPPSSSASFSCAIRIGSS